ncbi:hydantoinase/oxoprolinase family protein [Edaphobacillus lindanitolerans]|uniref:N-methylhydantoinase A n=1 Tax=Edaphobacillus lindanitolerans TaxID=550447 RepID=A0A1U7PIB9_9BACI|nr:hydantoinase/oxoprolinase family protein [Edaphobacillus lindanitolerans]SIT72941.1 N-methylhydantoinase A [Edaphobacillus lindanitolerans]
MRIATDIGGTFTDLVYIDEHDQVQVAKSSTTPPDFEQGVMNVIERGGLEFSMIEEFIHGSTVVINAITERKGVKTALITTKGFRDVLEIARGNRPDLFNIRYEKPAPFVERYLRKEVEERLNANGEVLLPLNKEELLKVIGELKQEQVEAVAVAYLHAYLNPEHELITKKLIEEHWPEVSVSVSHEVTMEWREYERTSSTVLNAYVQPVASSYIDRLDGELKFRSSSRNYIMQSNGGTTTFEHAKELPLHMLESGPVAGVYGAAVLGREMGESDIIAFDIGGTTAKCSLIEDGEMKISTDYSIEKDNRNAGYPVKVPVVDIVEIGNGGGSIAWIDEVGSLKVGPRSAGSRPGPVAYGLGGEEPTTTDANLLTGRLSPKNFDYNVDIKAVGKSIQERIGDHFGTNAEDAALGIIRIANANMLTALKLISIRKGHDPRNFSLMAFGGGGSMHAAALAKELGVQKVIIPFASPVFSAWGMLMTDLRQDKIVTLNESLKDIDPVRIHQEWTGIEARLQEQFISDGFKEEILFKRYVDMRYAGQEHTVKVPVMFGEWGAEQIAVLTEHFHELHEKNYTFRLPDAECEIVNLHVTAIGEVRKPPINRKERLGKVEDALKETRPVYFEETGWTETPIYDRELLPTGQRLVGPLIVEEKAAVTVVESGQSLSVDTLGNLIISTGVTIDERNKIAGSLHA